MVKQRLAIVRGERINNRSAKGNPSYGKLKGLMNYLAHGRYVDQLSFGEQRPNDSNASPALHQRGRWLDHKGAEITHKDSLAWAKQKVQQFGYAYTYQLLLSTRHGGLTSQDFNQVLTLGSPFSGMHEWRMMLHADTHNQHAHVILLRQEKLSKAEYIAWQQQMQRELERLQAERQHERQLDIEQTVPRKQGEMWTAAVEQAQPKQRQQQGWELD